MSIPWCALIEITNLLRTWAQSLFQFNIILWDDNYIVSASPFLPPRPGVSGIPGLALVVIKKEKETREEVSFCSSDFLLLKLLCKNVNSFSTHCRQFTV